jgi:hypothetical protein
VFLVPRTELANPADAIDVTQDHMTAEPLVCAEGALEIDLLSNPQGAQGGATERLGHGLDGEAALVDGHRGLAGPVDIDAIAYRQVGEHVGRGDFQALEVALALRAAHPAQLFYESGEHAYCTSAV